MTLLSIGTVFLLAGAAAAQNGGNAVQHDIPAQLDIPDPPVTGQSGGMLASDHANGNSYRDGESAVACGVGRRRTISLSIAGRSSRTMFLDLGTELPPIAGDNLNNLGRVFINQAPRNIPDPSDGPDGQPGGGDDGEITDVELQLAGRENVSALGAFPVDQNVPNYCYPNGSEVPDELIDPNDPNTFSRMCTVMRLDFKVGPHQWRLFFGPPNRRFAAVFQPTHPDAGPVVIERVFPAWPIADPSDPSVPWRITVEPWSTQDPFHPRYGMVVGYLYYRGTRKQDPYEYAGAFDIRWASGNEWTASPLQ